MSNINSCQPLKRLQIHSWTESKRRRQLEFLVVLLNVQPRYILYFPEDTCLITQLSFNTPQKNSFHLSFNIVQQCLPMRVSAYLDSLESRAWVGPGTSFFLISGARWIFDGFVTASCHGDAETPRVRVSNVLNGYSRGEPVSLPAEWGQKREVRKQDPCLE